MKRILVIDDENHVTDFLEKALKHFGYEVTTAHDGKEGVGFLKSGYNFDLVITDIRMPDMDGNEVARYIRKSEKPKTPIVAISGYSDEIKPELFDATLIKPFKLEVLMDAINSVQ